MYNNPVGPMAATGLGAGTALFAFTPLSLIWVLLAAFAIAGAVGALLRVAPSMRRPGRRPKPPREVSFDA